MQYKYINKEIEEFEKYNNHLNLPIIGCTEEEIHELEKFFQSEYKLPEAYIEFLRYGGRKMGRLFRLVDFSYGSTRIILEDIDREVIHNISRYKKIDRLPDELFVFANHLGDEIYFFKLNEGDNPPVYRWDSGNHGGLETAKKESESFSDFLMIIINESKNYAIQDGSIPPE